MTLYYLTWPDGSGIALVDERGTVFSTSASLAWAAGRRWTWLRGKLRDRHGHWEVLGWSGPVDPSTSVDRIRTAEAHSMSIDRRKRIRQAGGP